MNELKEKLFDNKLKLKKQEKKKRKKRKTAWMTVFFLIVLFLTFSHQIIPSSSIEVYSGKKQRENEQRTIVFGSFPISNPSEESSSDKNILVLGRPGQGYSGSNLTDTIILAHLTQDSPDKKAVLISLPRDLLVKVPNRETLTKINSLYSLSGIKGLKEKVTEITGFPIDHHLIVDLTVFEEIINLVDGLNIYVEEDINDPYFPGPNYSHQTFNLSAGWRYLDGPTALRYVRTRYTSPNGDFDRMARQQQVIQLLKQKVLALNPLWDFPTYLKIFNSLNNHIETDLTLLKMRFFYQLAKDIGADKIKSIVVDRKETGLLTGGGVMLGEQLASVVYPITGQGNYQEIQEYITKYLD